MKYGTSTDDDDEQVLMLISRLSISRDIKELESRITYGFGCSILDKFNDKVQEICDTLQFSLYTRRRNKFNKLALSPGDDTSLGDMVSVEAEQQ